MSLESVRAFFAEKAPDIAVIESTMSSATVMLAAEAYGVEPARIAKTLTLADRRPRGADRGGRHLADGQQEGEGGVRRQAEDARRSTRSPKSPATKSAASVRSD